MNISLQRLVLMLAVLMVSFGSHAQTYWNTKPTKVSNKENLTVTAKEAKSTPSQDKPAITSSYRYHRKLSKTHTGIVIELAASNFPLERDKAIFKQFGNVYYDKLIEGGYSYVIKTNFTSFEATKNFLNNIIIHKAPEARIIEYKEGKRRIPGE